MATPLYPLFRLLRRLNFFNWLGRALLGPRISSVAGLTIKAAIRFRLFPVLFIVLMLIVYGLPAIIKDDGTARGLAQILLTYTLGLSTVVLGLSTLWLACGTLARDVEECQMQVVAVKPIARWEIWVGKWVGLLFLNAVLLTSAGVAIYSMVLWRAAKLPASQQDVLRNEVLIGRNSFKPPVPDLEGYVREALQQVFAKAENPTPEERRAIENIVRQTIKSKAESIPPRGGYKRWEFDLGSYKERLRNQPLFLRVKFITAESRAAVSNPKTYPTVWLVGPPESARISRMDVALPSETYHEFPVPPNSFDDRGILTVDCYNAHDGLALVFSVDDGMELLYRESGFGLNFARGLFIIYLWLALMAALGLAAASFLSFPVAAFLSLSVLLMALASGMLGTVVQEGSINGVSPGPDKPFMDHILLPLFAVMVKLVNLAQGFSPIDSLSSGRSVTWLILLRAFGQIILLMCGLLAAFGTYVFTRRELATAQGQQ